VSRYRIERLIGMGGMAMVYEARWLLPGGENLPVACKLMREERRAVPHYCELVSKEAVLGLRVTRGDPNLVGVLDFFEDRQDGLCIVMELVDGCTLNELLRPDQRLPFPVTRRIVRAALKALSYLHGLDVLHRDLSPCNILVSAGGAVKVSDLGIAKVMEQGQAHTHTFRGKPIYASPEALERSRLDPRSDLYALGTILYELLAGAPPCGEERELVHILARMHREDFAPLPPDTPQDLAELAMGLIRTDPNARRPQNAAEALALLRHRGQPVASKAEMAAVVASVSSQRGAAPGIAGSVKALAPGDVLMPRAAPKGRPVRGIAQPERNTASFVPSPLGSLSLTRTMLGALVRGDSVAMRAVRAAVVMAGGIALGFVLHDRLGGEANVVDAQRSDTPSRPHMEAAQPAPYSEAKPSEPSPAVAVQAAEQPRTNAATDARKRRHDRQSSPTTTSSKEPKNVAPVASIPR
jgi:hypothetical protein